jgi:hypothetical protein
MKNQMLMPNTNLSSLTKRAEKINTNLLHERHIDVGKTRKTRNQGLQSYAW